jgi:hypothetical protein
LNVTIVLALPLIAVSKTMSSSGSDSLGRHRNASRTGLATAVIENMTDFGTTQSRCGQMLGAGHDRFVLKDERNRKQQFKLPI